MQVETFRPTRPLLSGSAPRSGQDPEAGGAPADWTSYSFLNIKRYRQYFNVDTGVRTRGWMPWGVRGSPRGEGGGVPRAHTHKHGLGDTDVTSE